MPCRSGYIMLLMTIVIGAVAVAIALTLLITSQLSYANKTPLLTGAEARALTISCVDAGLARVVGSHSSSTVFSDTILFTEGTCTFVATKIVDQNNVEIVASSTVGKSSFVIRAIAGLSLPTVFTGWQEGN